MLRTAGGWPSGDKGEPMNARRRVAAVVAVCLGVLGACGSDSEESGAAATTAEAPETTAAAAEPTEAPATTEASADEPATTAATAATTAPAEPVEMTKLSLGAVPTLDLGTIGVGNEQGIFERAGLEIEITFADGGPAVVTGVVSGQFDIGYTAWTPPLLAIAGDQPLRLVTGVAGVGPEGSNSLVLVRDDSGIESYADLTGKKVATNAPRSVLALLAVAAATADGGDGSSIEIVPLPFGEVARAVAEGTVDAGVTVEPFITAAAEEYPNVVSIGDPSLVVQQERDPSTLIFTSADTLSGEKADAIARFTAAFAEAAAYANENPDDVRRLGAEITDVPEAAAAIMPVSPMVPEIDPARLQPLLDAMLQYAWIEEPIDLTEFLGG